MPPRAGRHMIEAAGLTGGGLTQAEAVSRLGKYGRNEAGQPSPLPARASRWLQWIVHPLADPLALLLLATGIGYALLGEREDAIIAAVVLVPVVSVTLVLEARSDRALERLRQLAAPTARVWRDGVRGELPAALLVPGDLIEIRWGDIVPANAALLKGNGTLTLDEAFLTGESQPVIRAADHRAMVYAGTSVLAGSATARVAPDRVAHARGRYRCTPDAGAPAGNATGARDPTACILACLGCRGRLRGARRRGSRTWHGLGRSAHRRSDPGDGGGAEGIPHGVHAVSQRRRLAARPRAHSRTAARCSRNAGSVTVICADKTGTLTYSRAGMPGGRRSSQASWNRSRSRARHQFG